MGKENKHFAEPLMGHESSWSFWNPGEHLTVFFFYLQSVFFVTVRKRSAQSQSEKSQSELRRKSCQARNEPSFNPSRS